jgi:hypothetical protein
MSFELLNNSTAYSTNLNEIFNFSPKRKIKISNYNNNISPYDKNFSYLISFHPISPYS